MLQARSEEQLERTQLFTFTPDVTFHVYPVTIPFLEQNSWCWWDFVGYLSQIRNHLQPPPNKVLKCMFFTISTEGVNIFKFVEYTYINVYIC